MDLACGKGRHSIFLNSLGYDVTGVDLSIQSILEASKNKNERLNSKLSDKKRRFLIHNSQNRLLGQYEKLMLHVAAHSTVTSKKP